MPIGNPANLTVITVYGTHLSIGAVIQTQLRTTLSAGAELLNVQVVRKAVGNECTAYITYETAP